MITPKGTLLFVSINGIEDTFMGTPTGKYAATLELSEQDYDSVKNDLQATWEESKEYTQVKDEVDVLVPNLGIKKKKDKESGEMHYYVKASTYKTKKNPDGSEKPRVVEIIDGSGSRLPDDTLVYNGSEGRLMFFLKPYNKAGKYGLHLYLTSIQVTKASNGSSEKFPVENDEEEPF